MITNGFQQIKLIAGDGIVYPNIVGKRIEVIVDQVQPGDVDVVSSPETWMRMT